MTQLQLPNLPEIDPRAVETACRKLARMVSANRRSFEVEQYRRRRSAALKHSRSPKERSNAQA